MVALALVVLLALGATGWFLARRDSNAARHLAREQRTADALRTARDALIGFAATYRNSLHPDADFGYLPCPDLDGDGSSETCGVQGDTRVGRLPTLTLGLPDLRDGDGECLWYAVAGSFKNNPKADILNPDSTGRFQLLDAAGAPRSLPGDQAGLAAAVIFAPGPPLPTQQRQSSTGRCGGDLSASAVGAYLESLQPLSGPGVLTVDPRGSTGNDRIVWITGDDIMRALKARASFASHLNTVLDATADCLRRAGGPAPARIESTANGLQLGRVPAFSGNAGACTSAGLRDAVENWGELMRYARCTDGTACLSSATGPCRGVLLFGGERLPAGQPRVTDADKALAAHYLESTTLAALSARQLGGLPSRILIPFARLSEPASADVAVCLP